MLDMPPQAVGWSLAVSEALEPGPLELDPALDPDSDSDSDSDSTASGCAPAEDPPAPAAAATVEPAFVEGGGTVRSLWQ